MSRPRLLLGVAGVAAVAFGAWSVLAHLLYRLPALVLWLALPLAVHDGLLVPAVLGGAYLVRRALPRPWWGPVVVGAVVTGGLLAVALADLLSPADGTVPGLLDRSYGRGLAVALAVTWAVTGGLGLLASRRRRRPAPGPR